jgi:hypothetical protein
MSDEVKTTVKKKRRKILRRGPKNSYVRKRATGRGWKGQRAADRVLAEYADSLVGKSYSEIATTLNERYQKVYNNLQTSQGKMLQEELEKELAHSATRVRHKAMAYFEKFLDDEKISPTLRLQAYRFALQQLMQKEGGPAPDELVFETMISTTGTIEKKSTKVYRKATVNGEDIPDDDNVFDVEISKENK